MMRTWAPPPRFTTYYSEYNERFDLSLFFSTYVKTPPKKIQKKNTNEPKVYDNCHTNLSTGMVNGEWEAAKGLEGSGLTK